MGKMFLTDLLLKMCVVHICDGGGNTSKYNLGYFYEPLYFTQMQAHTTSGLIKHFQVVRTPEGCPKVGMRCCQVLMCI